MASKGERYVGQEHSDSERHSLNIKDDTLHSHAGIRLNYTTYDVRRSQDTINLKSGRNCVLAETDDLSSEKPFLYARILGIFHANVSRNARETPQRIDFLWVRWFQNTSYRFGLPILEYHPLSDNGAFGFISPGDVVRACHITPAFSSLRNEVFDGRGRRKVATFAEDHGGDWNRYYLGR